MNVWKTRRLEQLQKMVKKGTPPEMLIDEWNDILDSNANQYEEFVEQREEKMRKHMISVIKEWRNIK